MESYKPIVSFNLGGLIIDIKPEAIIQLVIILLIGILAWYSTKDLKSKPQSKKQVIVEYLYNLIKNVVDSNMGKEYRDVIPFIGTLAIFILTMNLTGLVGIAAPTKNFSVTIALSLIVFVFIQVYTIRKTGIKRYFGGYAKPMAVMLPINILERVMLPISLALRLFGNILAATVLVELVYKALS